MIFPEPNIEDYMYDICMKSGLCYDILRIQHKEYGCTTYNIPSTHVLHIEFINLRHSAIGLKKLKLNEEHPIRCESTLPHSTVISVNLFHIIYEVRSTE